MADNGLSGFRLSQRIQRFGQARALKPHINTAELQRGQAAGRGGGGSGGFARGFQGGGAAPERESGDPAVTGVGYEHKPYIGPFDQGLTEGGKQQQSDNAVLKRGADAYSQAIAGGADGTLAAHAAVRAGGVEFVSALLRHQSSPLASVPAFHQFLQGFGDQQTQGPAYGQITKEGQQPVIDPNTGEVTRMQDVPGFRGPPQKAQDVPASQRPVKGPGGQFGTYSYGPGGTTTFHPSQMEGGGAQPAFGAKPPPVKATTMQQSQELENLRTVMSNLDTLNNTVGATGSLGYGFVNRQLAEKTPLGGVQAQAYNAAYNQLAPALLALTRAPGISSTSKAGLEILKDQLPDPAHANLYNVQQVLPRLGLQMRQRIGALTAQYQAENRPGALTQATELGRTYDANPQMMADLEGAYHQLRTNPGAMTNQQVALLNQEGQGGRLAYDDWARVQRQGVQRGMISQQDYGNLVSTNPDLGQISQPERVTDPTLLKPMSTDQVTAGHTVAMQPEPVETGNSPEQQPQQPPAGMQQTGPNTWATPGSSVSEAPAQAQPLQGQLAPPVAGQALPNAPPPVPVQPQVPQQQQPMPPQAGQTAPTPQVAPAPPPAPAASPPAPAVTSPVATNALPSDQGEAAAAALLQAGAGLQ